jgi:hypothetical protein
MTPKHSRRFKIRRTRKREAAKKKRKGRKGRGKKRREGPKPLSLPGQVART